MRSIKWQALGLGDRNPKAFRRLRTSDGSLERRQRYGNVQGKDAWIREALYVSRRSSVYPFEHCSTETEEFVKKPMVIQIRLKKGGRDTDASYQAPEV